MLKDLLDLLVNPVLLPLAISLVTWLVNTYTNLLQKLPSWATRVLIVVVPTTLAYAATWIAQKTGLPFDISTVDTAAGSLVALAIFHIGRAKRTP